MNSKQRVLAAFAREETDRFPIYYSAVQEVDEKLMKCLGASNRIELTIQMGSDMINIVPDYVGPADAPAWTNTNDPALLAALRKGDMGALAEYHFPESRWYDGRTVVAKIEAIKKYNMAIALGDEALGSLLTMTGTWFGWEHLLTLMYDNPAFVHNFIEKICDFAYGMSEDMLIHGAAESDFYWFGDDVGTQLGLIISPELWKTFLMPQYKRLIKLANSHNLMVIQHSCGAISEIMSEMVRIGVDVINPVQVSACGMEPERLSSLFGDDLMFFGGVDTQHLLPNGTPHQIHENIDKLKTTLGKRKSWIIAPSQLLDTDIPVENILAMYDYIRR